MVAFLQDQKNNPCYCHKVGGAKSAHVLEASFDVEGDIGLFNVPTMNILEGGWF